MYTYVNSSHPYLTGHNRQEPSIFVEREVSFGVAERRALVTRIDTIFIPVTDLKRSAEWYERLLDLDRVYVTPDTNYIGFRFKGAGPQATALTLFRSETIPQCKHAAFNLFTSDVEEAHRIFQEKQVKVTEVHDEAGMQFFDFWDLDGNWAQLISFPE